MVVGDVPIDQVERLGEREDELLETDVSVFLHGVWNGTIRYAGWARYLNGNAP